MVVVNPELQFTVFSILLNSFSFHPFTSSPSLCPFWQKVKSWIVRRCNWHRILVFVVLSLLSQKGGKLRKRKWFSNLEKNDQNLRFSVVLQGVKGLSFFNQKWLNKIFLQFIGKKLNIPKSFGGNNFLNHLIHFYFAKNTF